MLDAIEKFEGIVEGKRIIWEGEGEVAWLEPYGPDAIRFRSSRSLRIDENLNWTLLPPTPDQAEICVEENRAVLKNGKLSAEILADGTVNYYKADGTPLLKESWKDFRVSMAPIRKAREFRSVTSDVFSVALYFQSNEKEHFYGLGQDANDCFDLKGSTVELLQKNGKSTIPFLYSSLGYGFIWNNPAIGEVQLTKNHTMWSVRAAKQIDYIIMADDTPAGILERYTRITGRAEELPEWAAGFWQCKLRYETQEELLEVAREYKRRGIPLSVIVCDYFHWTMQGEWKFDPKYWPDPKAMVRELKEMGIRLMVSIWPTVDPRSEYYDTMSRKNYLIRAERGVSTFFMFLGAETYYDATHPGARSFIWDVVKKNYYDAGIRMFWLDEAEPEVRPYDYDNLRYYLGNGLEMSSIYPYYHAKAFADGMRREGEHEIVNLVRCAWLGSQREGVVLWSGDIASTFESMRKQIKVGLHVAMTGIPWWTTDIGGFLDGDPEDPLFRELLVRWFQFGAFCPIFRLHGFRLPYKPMDINNPNDFCASGGPNEVWSFGEEAYQILVDFIQLRERMKPYIMEQMRVASQNGTPVMRPLFYDYPEDEKTYEIGDAYLFGPDILVAPVTEAGAKSRSVYLPKGANWVNYSTGETWEGGQTVRVEAPLAVLPLFIREGAKPIQP